MKGKKLCMGLMDSDTCTWRDMIALFARTGFEGVFTGYDSKKGAKKLKEYRACIEQNGMYYQSVHAPFGGSAKMWRDGVDGDAALDELICCVEDCSAAEVPLVVAHTYIGFDTGEQPTALGLERYGKLVDRAAELGVKIAFENTEGEEFLDALMKEFKGRSNVGFCWDSGHQKCYNNDRNLLGDYGDVLFGTHINDNIGVRSFEGKTTFYDDLHLLPFDGAIDWEEAAERLAKTGFDGPLTFELTRSCKPNRYENRKYSAITIEEYLAEAYIRACRFATMLMKEEEKLKK